MKTKMRPLLISILMDENNPVSHLEKQDFKTMESIIDKSREHLYPLSSLCSALLQYNLGRDASDSFRIEGSQGSLE